MNFTVLDLPIEPIDSRYSTQWTRWFQQAYLRHSVPYCTIYGDSSAAPAPDKFLDPFGTFRWKFSQLDKVVSLLSPYQKIKEKFRSPIEDGRFVIFLHDGWMPGIEAFTYIRDLAKMDIKVCGFFHAGSWDQSDLLGRAGCDAWATGSEESWFAICDRIFVGSEYHAEMISQERVVDDTKIVVTGCPVEVPVPCSYKDPVVVWPHRLSDDKNPQKFEEIKKKVSERIDGVEFIRTMDHNLSKVDYYALLARSKVALSTASHENFGIAMVEAAMLGCYPICPDGLSYLETMEDFWRYEGIDQAMELICMALKQEKPYEYPFKERFCQQNVTDIIVKELIEVGNA